MKRETKISKATVKKKDMQRGMRKKKS